MTDFFCRTHVKKIYIPFFGTLNAILKNFSQKFGIPQLFDEATVSSGVNMENLLYTITLEQDKSRCNTNADLKESDTWKLIGCCRKSIEVWQISSPEENIYKRTNNSLINILVFRKAD